MLRKRTLLLFLLALVLRLLLQGWDAGVTSSSSHPDERQVGYVTERAEGWFSDPGFYAYGSLHFHAIRATATVLGLGDEVRGLIVSGRVISLIAAMLALALGWLIAYHAWGRRTGDLFILLAAWVPLDLQQSHFTTVEAHHTGWVMAALAACFWLARSGRPIAAAASGAAIGASLAVKVASLALGLPLVVAVVIVVRGRDVLAAVRLLAIAGATGIAGFWLCQPWAFANGRPPFSIVVTALIAAVTIELANRKAGRARSALLIAAVLVAAVSVLQMAALVGIGGETLISKLGSVVLDGTALNATYLEGVGHEVAMVVGTTDLAYVRIYAHTLPVLYSLRELALWGWGVLLVLAAIAGSVAGSWRLTKRWRKWFAGGFNDSSILLAILLAWLVPMALRLSTLQVKFLRYWGPLVVPATLIASWWLMRLPRRVRRRAVISVAAGTVLWGLAYCWAFIEPHPHQTASEWFSPMLADKQVVAFEHWDEHIALNIEKGVVDRAELPSYELPENERKLALWTEALARSDWVVLTSNRVYRTVLANPDRFEETARLYRLLLSGEAGFAGLRPWGDINTLSFGVPISWGLDDKWTLFVIPNVRLTAERGARLGDSVQGGGFAGASFRVNDRLTIGPGVGVVTQIGDSPDVFPVLLVNWKITDSLSLETGRGLGATLGPGLFLNWEASGKWRFSLGGRFERLRFRLNDDGIAPEGVGEDRSFPIFVGVTHRFNRQVQASFSGGVELGGRFKLDDENGNEIIEEDYDTAGFVGITFRYRF